MSQPSNQSDSSPDFSALVFDLLIVKGRLDKQIWSFEQEAKEIRAFYAPRAEFERWKVTEDGKAWKKKQHKRQQGCCACCGITIEVKGSHIDHIHPLSKFPELAIDMKNLRLLCPDCNTKKGSKCEDSVI